MIITIIGILILATNGINLYLNFRLKKVNEKLKACRDLRESLCEIHAGELKNARQFQEDKVFYLEKRVSNLMSELKTLKQNTENNNGYSLNIVKKFKCCSSRIFGYVEKKSDGY